MPQVNPPGDHVVTAEEWIICVARDERIEFDRAKALPLRAVVPGDVPQPARQAQIVILGWNDQLYDVLAEFDGSMSAPTSVVIAAAWPEEHATALLKEHLTRPLHHAVVSYQRLDTSKQSALAKLPIASADHLIILADESSHELEPDARTIMTVLSLRTLQPGVPAHARVVAEVVNADNCELLQAERGLEFVVSPAIVSMLLTQLSQQLMLKEIYEDLLSAGGHELYLRPVRRYAEEPARCTFEAIAAVAAMRSEVAIGYLRGGSAPGVHLNPARGEALTLSDEDRVIVVASER